MKEHVDLVGLLYVIWGMLSLLVGVALFSLGLGASAIAGAAPDYLPGDALAARLTAAVFVTLAAVVLLWAVAHIWDGRALARGRPAGRAVGLVLAVANLFILPFGTALGVYTLWVLLHDSTRATFESSRA